jgi:uncharacterized membrane protein YfcA
MAVAVFALIYRKSGVERSTIQPSARAELVGYVFTFLLGIYGGFFSGGYITILTAVYVAFFRLSFLEAMATTKLINIFSSAIVTSVFMWHGLVEYRLGLILGVTTFVGALVGARLAIRVGNEWLRRITAERPAYELQDVVIREAAREYLSDTSHTGGLASRGLVA